MPIDLKTDILKVITPSIGLIEEKILSDMLLTATLRQENSPLKALMTPYPFWLICDYPRWNRT